MERDLPTRMPAARAREIAAELLAIAGVKDAFAVPRSGRKSDAYVLVTLDTAETFRIECDEDIRNLRRMLDVADVPDLQEALDEAVAAGVVPTGRRRQVDLVKRVASDSSVLRWKDGAGRRI